ncbi:FAD-dependent oxidoreductase [Providencia stuartii]|nr:FAD-dependent oxidoreductase [Providencia stuartii]WAZ82307.1 FAD-dependent oxidoreductase [Providencia stuartii]
MDKKRSVIVIGGGIIGLSIALTLQADGTDVLLVEKEQVGAGASMGNAGHIATEQVFPVADPSILKSIPAMLFDPLGALRLDWRYLLPLTPWLLRLLGNMRHKPFQRIHHALSTINGASLAAWQAFSDDWQLADLVKIQGSLLVAEREASYEKLQKQGEYLNSIGVKNQLLTQAQLLAREPALAGNQLGGLYYPDTGHVVDLNALHTQLTNHFLRLGGSYFLSVKLRAFIPLQVIQCA